MNGLRRWCRAAAVFAVALLVATACSSNSGKSKGGDGHKLSVAFANYTNNSTLFGPILDGVKKAAASGDIKLSLYDNKADGQTALQNAQLMVQSHPDVIIEYNPDPGLADAIGTVFSRAKIPCIALNVETTGCSWLNVVNQDLGTAAGKIAADYSKQHGWSGSNTTVMLVSSPKVGNEVINTVRYLYLTLAAQVSGYKVITEKDFTPGTTRISDNAIVINGGTSADTAFSAAQSALQNIPKNRHIIVSALNDDLTSGAWRAISQAGRANNSIAIGEGASQTSLKALQSDPGWVGEIDAMVSVWGYYAVAMADAIAKGAKAPELTRLPFAALTKANLSQYYSSTNLSRPKALPPADSSNKYLYGSGILEAYGK